jgi:hypothetical protein
MEPEGSTTVQKRTPLVGFLNLMNPVQILPAFYLSSIFRSTYTPIYT